MTPNERLIWAATYAQVYLHGPSQKIGHVSTIERAASAARVATQAVSALNAARAAAVIAGDDAHQDAEEMLR